MADNKVNSGLLEFSEEQKVFVALDAETSEVKKAVTIDGDGVETDIQGVQPAGKKEITSTAEVNVASYATAQVVDEDLVAGNIKKDVDILGVVGSYEGGGASDFSTATLTLVNNSEVAALNISVATAIEEDEGEPATSSTGAQCEMGDTIDFEVILYKGYAYAVRSLGDYTNMDFAIAGDITTEGLSGYVITGDCTITMTDKNIGN